MKSKRQLCVRKYVYKWLINSLRILGNNFLKELRNIEVIRKTDKKKQKQKIAGSFMLIKEPAYTYIYIFIFFCSCCFFCNIVQSEII